MAQVAELFRSDYDVILKFVIIDTKCATGDKGEIFEHFTRDCVEEREREGERERDGLGSSIARMSSDDFVKMQQVNNAPGMSGNNGNNKSPRGNHAWLCSQCHHTNKGRSNLCEMCLGLPPSHSGKARTSMDSTRSSNTGRSPSEKIGNGSNTQSKKSGGGGGIKLRMLGKSSGKSGSVLEERDVPPAQGLSGRNAMSAIGPPTGLSGNNSADNYLLHDSKDGVGVSARLVQCGERKVLLSFWCTRYDKEGKTLTPGLFQGAHAVFLLFDADDKAWIKPMKSSLRLYAKSAFALDHSAMRALVSVQSPLANLNLSPRSLANMSASTMTSGTATQQLGGPSRDSASGIFAQRTKKQREASDKAKLLATKYNVSYREVSNWEEANALVDYVVASNCRENPLMTMLKEERQKKEPPLGSADRPKSRTISNPQGVNLDFGTLSQKRRSTTKDSSPGGKRDRAQTEGESKDKPSSPVFPVAIRSPRVREQDKEREREKEKEQEALRAGRESSNKDKEKDQKPESLLDMLRRERGSLTTPAKTQTPPPPKGRKVAKGRRVTSMAVPVKTIDEVTISEDWVEKEKKRKEKKERKRKDKEPVDSITSPKKDGESPTDGDPRKIRRGSSRTQRHTKTGATIFEEGTEHVDWMEEFLKYLDDIHLVKEHRGLVMNLPLEQKHGLLLQWRKLREETEKRRRLSGLLNTSGGALKANEKVSAKYDPELEFQEEGSRILYAMLPADESVAVDHEGSQRHSKPRSPKPSARRIYSQVPYLKSPRGSGDETASESEESPEITQRSKKAALVLATSSPSVRMFNVLGEGAADMLKNTEPNGGAPLSPGTPTSKPNASSTYGDSGTIIMNQLMGKGAEKQMETLDSGETKIASSDRRARHKSANLAELKKVERKKAKRSSIEPAQMGGSKRDSDRKPVANSTRRQRSKDKLEETISGKAATDEEVVQQILSDLNLPEYRDTFKREAIVSLKILRELSKNDLKSLGIPLGHCIAIMKAANRASGGSGEIEDDPDAGNDDDDNTLEDDDDLTLTSETEEEDTDEEEDEKEGSMVGELRQAMQGGASIRRPAGKEKRPTGAITVGADDNYGPIQQNSGGTSQPQDNYGPIQVTAPATADDRYGLIGASTPVGLGRRKSTLSTSGGERKMDVTPLIGKMPRASSPPASPKLGKIPKSKRGNASPRLEPVTPLTVFSRSRSQSNTDLDPADIDLGERIGSGNFGNVYKGTWRGTTTVAIKELLLHADRDHKLLRDAMSEAELMKQLPNHPHVVTMMGWCVTGSSFYMLTEFVHDGSLLDYLRKNVNAVPYKTMMQMISHIVAGMIHLESNNIVHRDLAARNLLLEIKRSGEHCIKVADFGLSRMVDDSTYTMSVDVKVPIKWTAPEALFRRQFNSKSDVWSFGIVMWELFTFGEEPWAGLNSEESIEKLKKRMHLPRPEMCPPGLYDSVMLKCWRFDPDERPSFRQLPLLLKPFAQ